MRNKDDINIVFIHGWGMNQGIWHGFMKTCMAVFPKNYVFQSIDLPGFGTQADVLLEQYSIENLSEAVAQQIKPNTILVAWSMGGLAAQYLANIKHPSMIAHIQMASTPKFSEEDKWHGIKPNVLSLFKEQLEHEPKVLLKRFLAIQCLGVDNAKKSLSNMYNAVNRYPLAQEHSLSASLDLLQNTDLRNDHDPLEDAIPCLRIFGALDSLVPKKAIPHIMEIYPQSELMVLPKASHAPFVSHADECAKVIADFANKL